jgi:hypothetical protein
MGCTCQPLTKEERRKTLILGPYGYISSRIFCYWSVFFMNGGRKSFSEDPHPLSVRKHFPLLLLCLKGEAVHRPCKGGGTVAVLGREKMDY